MQEHMYNAIGHFDIAGPDADLLGVFYSNVFDWRVDAQGPGYALIDTPQGTPGAAITEAEEAAITIGVVVPDLGRAVAAAVANGGDIAMPPTDNGWVRKGVLIDPAGNHVTDIQA